MSIERVLTVLGNKATRPITDFLLSSVGLGDVYYVSSDSGDDERSGLSPETCLATLDAAIGKCTANQGDIIYILPGHTETVATAGAIAVDVAGITIIGLGDGADKPTFSFSAVDATMTVSAASTTIKGIIIKPSIDSVVSPIVVSAADVTLDIEAQDASALIEMVTAILTTAAAERLNIKLKYRGFIAGNACVSPIRLVGVDTARIYVDFYGVASTSVIEFHTTACHDIDITGLFYNNGTSLTKNVVDTVTGSTWSARGWDGNSNASFSGGDNAALASDDSSAIAAAVAVIDGLHDVPTKDAVTDLYIRDVVGRKTDTAAAGAVSEVESLMAYAKQIVTSEIANTSAIGVIDGFHDVPTADDTDNAQMRDVIGNKEDAAATGAVSTTETLMAYAKQNVTNTEAIAADTAYIADGALPAAPTANSLAAYIASGGTALGQELPDSMSIVDVVGDYTGPHDGTAQDDNIKASLDLAHTDLDTIITAVGTTIPGTILALPKCVEKSDGIVADNTTDDLFTITGGPVRCKIVGLVTTVIGGAANMKLQHTTTSPAATVELNAGAVAIDNDAVGTLYQNIGATSVFTPSDTLGVELTDPVTVEECEFILTPGTVKAHGSATQTGNIKWYMTYTPMSPSSVVTAAA